MDGSRGAAKGWRQQQWSTAHGKWAAHGATKIGEGDRSMGDNQGRRKGEGERKCKKGRDMHIDAHNVDT